MKPRCRYLGFRKGVWTSAGTQFQHYECRHPQQTQCVINGDHPSLISCESCPFHEASVSKSDAKADVIIPTHNYGQYLEVAIDSAMAQSHLGEIVVIDDASHETDSARQICEAKGIKYIRVEHRNVYLTRKEGVRVTKSPFLVCLDADDALGPDYIAMCLNVMEANESTGIVTTDLALFGDRSGAVQHAEKNIESQNWIHAGSMVRRSALDSSQAFDQVTPATNSHADWYVWRTVMRAGWKASRCNAQYLYRQHGESMMRSLRSRQYYDLASLATEPITLVVPLAGRRQYWPRLRDWIDHQDGISDILLIDSGSDQDLRSEIRNWLLSKNVRSTKYVSLPPSNGLADQERRNRPETFKAVQRAMPVIYREMRDAVTTEYVVIVEDDVLPPVDAIDRLLHSMTEQVAAVSGLVVSRWHPTLAIAWVREQEPHIPLSRNPGGVQEVLGTGFGCLLLRRSAMLAVAPFHSGGTGNYDVEFAKSIAAAGWQWKLDWTITCDHAGIVAPAAVVASKPRQEVDFMPCAHLGDEIRQDKCEICGSQAGPKGTRVSIRACVAHGECAATRYKQIGQPAICNRLCQSFTGLVQLSTAGH